MALKPDEFGTISAVKTYGYGHTVGLLIGEIEITPELLDAMKIGHWHRFMFPMTPDHAMELGKELIKAAKRCKL